MKKTGKKEHLNLFFSAFLILAFIVCANFFAGFSASMGSLPGQLVMMAVYAVFGLLLFYATRVGDGKAVFRFSPLTLLVLVLPTLVILVASLAPFMPFHSFLAADKVTGQLSVIAALSAVAFGYGLPYTFVSGFELAREEDEADEDAEEETEVLEGGVEADLQDAEDDASDEAPFTFSDDTAYVQDADAATAEVQEDKGYSLDTFDTDEK